MSWRAERLLVQLPRYRAPGPPERAATATQSDFFMGLDKDAAGVVVGHVDDVPSLRKLTQVNTPLKKLAESALWKQFFFFNSEGTYPKTKDEVTDMRIDRYLKADGFGVRALADACQRFSNLVRLHAHGCTVDLAAIRSLDPPPSLAEVRSHVTVPASASAHGLALAVYALAQLLADKDATVPDSAFKNDGTITSIEVPNGFTAIGKEAFCRCTSLASVELPAGLKSIGDSAFFTCTSLAWVVFPAGLTTIGNYAFQHCTKLASVELPAGLTSIGAVAFSACRSLASVQLPAGLTTIGNYAFDNCTKLASVVFPAGLTSIGAYAFQGCSSLASIDLPAGLTSIGARAFSWCTSLTSVELPASLTTLGGGAFSPVTTVRRRVE